MSRNKNYVVLPAYNESSVIAHVIRELKSHGYDNIIVVDDGSDDSTYQMAKEQGVTAIRHSLNRGKGAAVKTGLEAAKRLGAEGAVTVDAAGQHVPDDIAKALDMTKQYDVVLGRRNFAEKHIPFYKKVGNLLGNIITWLVYGLWVSDSQSGMRAYSKRALELMDTTADRYEFDSEVMREIVRNNLKYTEMTIKVRYTEYSQKKQNRQSFMSALQTVLRMVLSR